MAHVASLLWVPLVNPKDHVLISNLFRMCVLQHQRVSPNKLEHNGKTFHSNLCMYQTWKPPTNSLPKGKVSHTFSVLKPIPYSISTSMLLYRRNKGLSRMHGIYVRFLECTTYSAKGSLNKSLNIIFPMKYLSSPKV